MKQIAILVLSALLLAGSAAGPSGFVQWRSSELKAYAKKLSPKINEQKFAMDQLGVFGKHSVVIVHREGTGEAEVHENMADLFVVQQGAATLVVGGKVVGAKQTQPGEIRGKSIQGGEKRPLGPGDMAYIPANLPHQVQVPAGKQITYVIVKLEK
jgi:mannose-6-phosphate isomerase-like protein (cupin superfamily)